MKIDCSKCHAPCCRLVSLHPDMKKYDRGDGACIHLKDDKCEIYETRPDICKVGVVYEKDFKDKMTEEEYLELTAQYCDLLRSLIKKVT